VDFYARALGLRLVKQTVSFDAPDSYHLCCGDEQGSPSSLLTFFPWPDVPQGRQGAGMTTTTAFSVPGSSLGWWHDNEPGVVELSHPGGHRIDPRVLPQVRELLGA